MPIFTYATVAIDYYGTSGSTTTFSTTLEAETPQEAQKIGWAKVVEAGIHSPSAAPHEVVVLVELPSPTVERKP